MPDGGLKIGRDSVPAGQTDNIRILVAGGNDHLMGILEPWSRKRGLSVSSCAAVAEGIALAGKKPFDMIIYRWPRASGEGMRDTSTLREIANSGRGNRVFLVAMAEDSGDAERLLAIETGADAFMNLPARPLDLIAHIKTGMRVVELERSLDFERRKLIHALDVVNVERQKNESLYETLRRDIRAASRIQKSLLPPASLSVPGYSISHLFRPCQDLAGDVYNLNWLGEGRVALYLADVSGHGVAASLVAIMITEYISTLCGRFRPGGEADPILLDPSKALAEINGHFTGELEEDRYFTMIYGVLQLSTGAFDYAAAGHSGMAVLGRGDIRFPEESGGPAIGIFDEADFPSETLVLEPGDRLFVYSDGASEARNSNLAATEGMLGDIGVRSILAGLQTSPLDSTLLRFGEALRAWTGHDCFNDDVTMLALERESSDSDR